MSVLPMLSLIVVALLVGANVLLAEIVILLRRIAAGLRRCKGAAADHGGEHRP